MRSFSLQLIILSYLQRLYNVHDNMVLNGEVGSIEMGFRDRLL
jgi:hypothetical protein